MAQHRLFVITNGFTLVGDHYEHPQPDWILIKNASVLRKYEGHMGLGGVTSGKDTTVVYDPIPEDVEFPVDKLIFVTNMTKEALAYEKKHNASKN